MSDWRKEKRDRPAITHDPVSLRQALTKITGCVTHYEIATCVKAPGTRGPSGQQVGYAFGAKGGRVGIGTIAAWCAHASRQSESHRIVGLLDGMRMTYHVIPKNFVVMAPSFDQTASLDDRIAASRSGTSNRGREPLPPEPEPSNRGHEPLPPEPEPSNRGHEPLPPEPEPSNRGHEEDETVLDACRRLGGRGWVSLAALRDHPLVESLDLDEALRRLGGRVSFGTSKRPSAKDRAAAIQIAGSPFHRVKVASEPGSTGGRDGLRQDRVTEHLQALQASTGDKEGFAAAIAALQADKRVRLQELFELAHLYAGGRRSYTSRQHAIEVIEARNLESIKGRAYGAAAAKSRPF